MLTTPALDAILPARVRRGVYGGSAAVNRGADYVQQRD